MVLLVQINSTSEPSQCHSYMSSVAYRFVLLSFTEYFLLFCDIHMFLKTQFIQCTRWSRHFDKVPGSFRYHLTHVIILSHSLLLYWFSTSGKAPGSSKADQCMKLIFTVNSSITHFLCVNTDSALLHKCDSGLFKDFLWTLTPTAYFHLQK